MIKVKRNHDGKVFTSDMSKDDCILEIHFCTSYTQVICYELDEDGSLQQIDIICPADCTEMGLVDGIAVADSDWGRFILTPTQNN